MANDVMFEGKERRMAKIEKCLAEYGIASLEDAKALCTEKGIDVESIVKGVQPIAFDNAVWAYTLGVALALKTGVKTASEAAATIGKGLQAFCVPGSVAEQRNVGLGHGNLGAMLLNEDTKCFAFLAGHESFAAAEGAIGIAKTANKVRKEPLRVILNGLGKDAAMIISRINGFTYVKTDYDFYTGELTVLSETPYSEGERAAVKCYGANDVLEGVAIMKKRAWMSPSRATPRTRRASSTWSRARIRNGRTRTASSTSPWRPAAARAERSTPTTSRRAPLLTASRTPWAECTATRSLRVPPPCRRTSK